MSDSDIVISVRNLGKHYKLGATLSHDTLRDAIVHGAKGLCSWLRRNGKPGRLLSPNEEQETKDNELRTKNKEPRTKNEIWALKDVSFDVKRGEVLGIIGRNGAGKSTLLKILSQITEPTEGEIRIRGGVATLLEVGTGMHPELTGRENVYLNGAILGMRKAEIDAKYDEIVGFAGIAEFMSTPIKRYSSGMGVRLGFAIAAHLEPDILIVDEVLAVGDAEFQKKCLGKMHDVAGHGRTVLLVSHNMKAIRSICGDTVWLDTGQIRQRGPAADITQTYLQERPVTEDQTKLPDLIESLPLDPAFRLLGIALNQMGEPVQGVVANGEPLEIRVDYEVKQTTRDFRIYFDLCDENDDILVQSYHDGDADERSAMTPGRYTSVAEIPADFLGSRRYRMVVRATIHNVRSCLPGGVAVMLDVAHTSRSNRAYVDQPCVGKLDPLIHWRTDQTAVTRFATALPTGGEPAAG